MGNIILENMIDTIETALKVHENTETGKMIREKLKEIDKNNFEDVEKMYQLVVDLT